MDVAEELLDVGQTVDRAYVEKRLDDWRERIDRLYADIESWLPGQWSMADGGRVSIHEDLMLKFGVPQRTLPIRTLLKLGRAAGRIEPRGLWIIGANGRVDLVLPTSHYLIVDRADSFEVSNWQIASLTARRDQHRLTDDVFKKILG